MSARQGKGMFNYPAGLADPASYWIDRWNARGATREALVRRYGAAMAAVLDSLDAAGDGDWALGANFYGHGFYTNEGLFHTPAQHLAEHTAAIAGEQPLGKASLRGLSLYSLGEAWRAWPSTSTLPAGEQRNLVTNLLLDNAGVVIATRVGPLRVRQVGAGPPAVLWHSLFVGSGSWRRVEQSLGAERRLILIDGPGHGASGDPGKPYTMRDCAGEALDVLDALKVAGPVDWVGNLSAPSGVGRGRFSPSRGALWLLFGWGTLNLIGGGLSVIPFAFLPFSPEQSVRHYAFHARYGAARLPLLVMLWAWLHSMANR